MSQVTNCVVTRTVDDAVEACLCMRIDRDDARKAGHAKRSSGDLKVHAHEGCQLQVRRGLFIVTRVVTDVRSLSDQSLVC